jgi:hypothetical protein
MSTPRQFNTPISLSSAALTATHNSNTVANIFTTGGNVGISNTIPSSKLHVVMGDATSAGSASLWDSTYSVFGQSSNTGGGVGIGYHSASGGCLVSLSPTIAWRPMNYRGLNHQFIISGTLGTPPSMIIASTGNVGIGTTSPGGTLDVKAGNWGAIRTFPNTSGTESAIGFLSNADGSLGGGPTTSNWLMGINLTGYPIGQFNFRSNALGTAAIFTIATNGNVGISTTSPVYTLDVNGTLEASNSNGLMLFASSGNLGINTTAPSLKLDINGSTRIGNSVGNSLQNYDNLIITPLSGQTQTQIGFNPAPGPFKNWIYSVSPGGMAIGGNGGLALQTGPSGGSVSTNMFIATSGNVGIGTTAPISLLHVNGNITFPYGNYIGTNQTFPKLIEIAWQNSQDQVLFYTPGANNGTAKMCLQHNGNVGIGTTSPSEVLHINNSADCYIRINAGAGDKSGIKMLGGGAGVSSIYQNDLTGDLQFDLDSTNLMTITRNGTIGNVGINTTNPSALLDVANGSDTSGVGGGPQISFQYRTSSGGGFRHFIRSRHNAVSANNSGNGIDFFLNNLNTATGSSAPGTGNVCTLSVTGSGVGFGTTTPSWPIHVTTNNGNYTWPAAGYYFTTTTTIQSAGAGGASINNSILAAGGITSNTGFYATSDIRIKKIIKQGIHEIDISQIDKLNITTFEYIDKLVHGNDSKLGFIAQNVHEFVPEAVTIRKEFVPNIFKVTSVNDGVIELTGHNLTVGTRIKIMIDEQDRNGTVVNVTSIVDENHFCIDYNLDAKDKLFIYGTEVDDFKELNYNHIFTLSVGAVQKLRQNVRQLEDKFKQLANFIREKFPGELNI